VSAASAAGSAAPLLASLVRASWQGALFIAALWVLCRLAPRLPAALRCALWWAASLKLLIALAWPAPLPVALLPAAAAPRPASTVTLTMPSRVAAQAPGVTGRRRGPSTAERSLTVTAAPAARQLAASGGAGRPDDTSAGLAALAAAALWACGLLVQLVWLGRELRRNRALVRASTPLADRRALELIAALRAEVGLRRPVEARCSPSVRSPQTVGLLRPLVLLPRELGAFSGTELAMALCHELLHLRRRDLWWGWVPLLAERIFFFHPLASLAAREYALAREAACDAEVVRLLAPAPRAYGRLLLKLTLTPAGAGIGGRHAIGALGAAPAVENLKRRLQMLHESSQTVRGSRRLAPLAAIACLLTFAALVPLEIVAQRADPAPAATASPSPQAAPEAAPAPGPPSPSLSPGPASAVPAAAAKAATTALRPLRALRPIARAAEAVGAAGDEQREPILYMSGNNVNSIGTGDESTRHIKSLQRKAGGGELLWFRRGGKEYLVRDAATLKRVAEIFAPQTELGRQQGELGAKQGALGAQQGELGSRQGKLGAEQGELGAEEARIALDDSRRALEGDEPAGEARHRELESNMRKLAEQQTELGRQQEELGRQQETLGEQQQKLGKLQQRASREAEAKLRILIDQALASGLAQEIR
jgi:bla regulator protein BlaR1